MTAPERSFTIGQAAQAAGVNVETIRFYERRGFVERPPDRAHGFRKYDLKVIRTIRFIKRAQELGFTLAEVGELLALRDGGRDGTCSDVKAAAKQKLADVERKLRDLEAVRRALRSVVRTCESNTVARRCPILASLNGDDDNGRVLGARRTK